MSGLFQNNPPSVRLLVHMADLWRDTLVATQELNPSRRAEIQMEIHKLDALIKETKSHPSFF